MGKELVADSTALGVPPAGSRGPPGFALGGPLAAPSVWTSSSTRCATAWAYDPAGEGHVIAGPLVCAFACPQLGCPAAGTPTDYVFNWGFLDAGMDLQTGLLTQEQVCGAGGRLRAC